MASAPPISNCPSCHAFQSVQLNPDAVIQCTECDFSLSVLCPFCDIGQLGATADALHCHYCKRSILYDTLQYILKNRLMVCTNTRCSYCKSPTLSRSDANITPRCFDHPYCGNQTPLFNLDAPRHNYVFLDFETTGLQVGHASIIEVGACRVNSDGREFFFQELVRPVSDIQPIITQITGIDNAMVTHAPPLKDVLSSFLTFSQGAYLVAHNAQFDVPWLLTSLIRHELDMPYTHLLCTLKWAKLRESGSRSLGALSKKYQIGHDNAHRALADAVVTKQLFFIYNETNADTPLESIDRYMDLSHKIVSQTPDFIQP